MEEWLIIIADRSQLMPKINLISCPMQQRMSVDETRNIFGIAATDDTGNWITLRHTGI
jgi:hypothetical protein